MAFPKAPKRPGRGLLGAPSNQLLPVDARRLRQMRGCPFALAFAVYLPVPQVEIECFDGLIFTQEDGAKPTIGVQTLVDRSIRRESEIIGGVLSGVAAKVKQWLRRGLSRGMLPVDAHLIGPNGRAFQPKVKGERSDHPHNPEQGKYQPRGSFAHGYREQMCLRNW